MAGDIKNSSLDVSKTRKTFFCSVKRIWSIVIKEKKSSIFTAKRLGVWQHGYERLFDLADGRTREEERNEKTVVLTRNNQASSAALAGYDEASLSCRKNDVKNPDVQSNMKPFLTILLFFIFLASFFFCPNYRSKSPTEAA